jgi:ethanolamine transporter EutH
MMAGMARRSERRDATRVVVRISPMAHVASCFLALGVLALVIAVPWSSPLLAMPILTSAMIVRYRTVADSQSVTARTLLDSRTVGWEEIKGLRFVKGMWARAELTSGKEMRLPAVTFSVLPQLTAISGGRVPNPYS